MKKIRAGIRYVGGYAPEKVLTNDDLSKMMDTSDEWITSRTGIKQRHIASDDQFTSHLAIEAVNDLLARHGDDALAGVDMVIVATNTPDAFFPATAALVQDHFKLTAGAFDLLAACPGWLYAVGVAKSLVESGQCKRVLTIGSEMLTKIIDWNDRSTAVLFGDGSGAAIVEQVPEAFGLKSMIMGADGSGADHLHKIAMGRNLPSGTPLSETLHMNGREVFKFAVRVMNSATFEAIEKAGMEIDDIQLFIPHQANLRIIEAARERLGLPPEKVVTTVQNYGNNSTASIPLAMTHAFDDGRMKNGDNTLLVSFGAGLTWAATVLTWGSE